MSVSRSYLKYLFIFLLCGLLLAGWFFYQKNLEPSIPAYIGSGNGRIEAAEYDVATKYAGRLEQVVAEEGDMVAKGQSLAKMNTDSIDAQLREARASLREAQDSRNYALAMLAVRQSELVYAQREQSRSLKLARSGNISQEKLDQDNTKYATANAMLKAAQIQITQADSGIEAVEAAIERLQVEHAEADLTSPISGRVLYKLARAGEVIGSGGKVLTVLDLTDVTMSIFIPMEQAGKVNVGSEARIILDAIPEYVIPATVSFVAPRTQFTPKAVETRTEREKLVFRVNVKIAPALLKEHIAAVKTGVPGEAFLLLDTHQEWPGNLQVKLP
jgi:HlyD family secretion protein